MARKTKKKRRTKQSPEANNIGSGLPLEIKESASSHKEVKPSSNGVSHQETASIVSAENGLAKHEPKNNAEPEKESEQIKTQAFQKPSQKNIPPETKEISEKPSPSLKEKTPLSKSRKRSTLSKKRNTPFWKSQTAKTLLGLLVLVLFFTWLAPREELNLLGEFFQKILQPKAKNDTLSSDDDGKIVSKSVTGLPFAPSASNNEEEEPPLPPPVRPGANKEPFTGHALEEPCRNPDEDPCTEYAMDPFYLSLEGVLRKEKDSISRLMHFGDSIIASDYISSRIRRRLASTFGDAGQGFIYLAKPSRWYYRDGVEHKSSTDWKISEVTSAKEGTKDVFGLGGASFEARRPGAKASFSTNKRKNKEIGNNVSFFDIYYIEQPEGGTLEISIDGEVKKTLSTEAETTRAAFHSLEVEDGPHTLSLRSLSKKVKAFGVVMERNIPGVVYDSLGLVSGSAKALLSIEKEHWKSQIVHRNPDLIILMFGTNEANYISGSKKRMATYQTTLETLLQTIKTAKPNVSCLLLAPPDAAIVKEGRLVTKSALPKLVEAQKRAALGSGCAFWNTFEWMGGRGSMAKWYRRGLGQSDYTHPTKKGAAKIGDAFFEALMAGYDNYVVRKQAQ